MLVRNTFTHDSRVDKEARTLSESGQRVTVVAEAGPGLSRRESRDGYEVIRVPRPLARIPLLRFFAYRQRLVGALVRTRPDILHAHDSDTLEPVAAAARRLGVPFIYDAHELWLGQVRRGRSRPYWWAFLAYYWIIERWLMRRAAAVITVSPPIARHLERAYRLPCVHLVPNYPEAGVEPVPRDLRSLPGGEAIPAEAPIVLYLGGIMPGRGIEQLVTAMGDVPGAHLVFLGYGAMIDQVMALAGRLGIQDRVVRLGPVPADEVVEYSASANVGVSAAIPSCLSYEYSLPNKLFQYMAAGLPVVASDFAHVRAVVTDTGAGLTVDMTQPSRIAAALRAVLGDPSEGSRMGRHARQAVVGQFNWSAAAHELLAVYATVSKGEAR